MKKRTKILTIVFSCIAACVVGISVFCVIFFGRSKKITPPSGDTTPADREIAQKFDLSPIYDGFTQVGWKVSRATDSAVSNGKLVVPKTYKNLPIVEIGNAFNGWIEIEQIVFSDSMKNIGVDNEKGSFKNCLNLTKIQFADKSGVINVGKNAFYGCSALSSIDLSLCEEIGNNAFENCSQLANVQIGNNLQKIGDYAFAYSKISEFVVPKSTTQIGTNPFAYGSLASISVDAENEIYSSIDNVVIESETNSLIIGCKNSTIQNGVLTISKNAFAGCNKNSITLPDSVRIVEEGAFESFLGTIALNDGLEIIETQAFMNSGFDAEEIPESVTTLGTEAFAGCTELGQNFVASGVYKIGIAVFSGTPIINLTLLGGSQFAPERQGSYDFKTGSLIQVVTYLEPIE